MLVTAITTSSGDVCSRCLEGRYGTGMSVKGQMFIDMKTRITSYGPHNGIIVHCGIQQEPDKFWPCIRNDTANSLSSRPLDIAPSIPATVHWPTVEDSDDNRSNAKSCQSRIPNQYYPLIVEDGTSSDNFNKSGRNCLDVFETNPVMAEPRSFDMGSVSDGSYKSNLGSMVSKISNNDVSNSKRFSTNAQNVDTSHWSAPNTKKAVKKKVSNQNISDSSNEVAKYDYNQIEKKSFLGEISVVRNDPKIIGESTSDGSAVHRQKIIRHEFSEHLADLATYPSNQCKKTPDLCQVREMETEMSEQLLSPLSSLDISKKHLNNDYDEHDKNLMKNFGLPLILENFSPESRLKKGNHTNSSLEYLQQYSQPSIDIFNDVDILRHACASQYVRSVIPISLNKMQESVVHIPDEIKNLNFISADETKNILKKTASEHSEVFPTKIPSITNSGQLKVTAEKRPERQQLMEKEENLENISEKLKNCNMEIGKNTALQKLDNTRSAITTSLKPILHMSSRKSNLSKKVRFPAEQPQVIALDHRLLLIDDLDLI
ncbi:unnamed protein product [Onchocerca ochengi]|uniref:CAP-Gly domain-containing protein n=1 Tax=Onchocerca ochengi TaxID=42157 RepID=A0A182E0I3_ONCOC|nr:unnamed protein product [Onchocerca ochengi]